MTARRWALRGAAAAVAVGLGVLLWTALRPVPHGLARAVEGRAVPGADGVPAITLVSVDGEYDPNVVHAKANSPLRVSVATRAPHACGGQLLVPDLGLELDVSTRGEATLLLPAAPAGAYLFTCGSRMVKGVFLFE